MGMIGGGRGAFIGAVHRIAANMDGLIEFKAGALSSHREVALESGRDLFLEDKRIYTDYREMIEQESQLPADERIDFVSIVTPNHVHFEPAMLALEHGFHVVIDKPITLTLDQAKQLRDKVKATGLHLCLTHAYAGYPMVKQARDMIENGELGKVRKIVVEYLQGWLSEPSEREGNKQAGWRTDPKRSGIAGCMGDIGTHAAHLAEYVSGLKITGMCAHLNTFIEGRQLDDDGNVLLRFEEGASGLLTVSQIAAGEENNLTLRVYGEKGGLEWAQMEPNTLTIRHLHQPTQVFRTNGGYPELYGSSNFNTRTPSGHPEGYLEAFANLYRCFAQTLLSELDGKTPTADMLDFPNEEDGVRGMAFIENVVASSKTDEKWKEFVV